MMKSNLDVHLRSLWARISRRQMLGIIGGASLIPIAACAKKSALAGECLTIPAETGGPFPGDGSNGPDALATSGIVRSDIRSSFAGMAGTAAGVPLTVKLSLVSAGASCEPLAGYAIYLWHCDREGRYSLYTIADQNYLRGVQETDGCGAATFTTIFPGAYPGRWPHIHFEVFPSLAAATASSDEVRTSQLAFPRDACSEVYATSGYEQSIGILDGISLDSDNVFGDGAELQLASVDGSATNGYVAELTVAIQTRLE